MCIKNILLTLFTAILVIGCASTSKPTPFTQAVTPVESHSSKQKGFSLALSGEEGWTVAEETPYKIVYSKQNPDKSERYLIQALVVKLPSFDSDQDFLNYVEKSIEKNRAKANLKVLEQQVGFTAGQGEKCVRYNSTEEAVAKSKKSIVLDMVNYTCRHPDKANTGVYVAYSKRSLADKADKNLMLQAENVFSSLSFNKF